MQTRLVLAVMFVCTCFVFGREWTMTKLEKLELKGTGGELLSPVAGCAITFEEELGSLPG